MFSHEAIGRSLSGNGIGYLVTWIIVLIIFNTCQDGVGRKFDLPQILSSAELRLYSRIAESRGDTCK